MECRRFHFPAIDSTNTWAKQNIHLFNNGEITLVTAARQHQGRGRYQREWVSPEGLNIYASFCFFVSSDQKDFKTISQVIGVSVAKALESEQVAVKFKWPNDMIWNGKKLGGILCETQRNDQICVIVGIGINVNMTAEQLQQIDQPATSLLEAGGNIIDLESVIRKLQNQVLVDLPRFLSEGFAPFYPEYKRRLIHPMHQHMTVQDGQIKREGLFQGIEPDGSLSLKLQSGEIKKLFSGELNR